MVGPLSMQHLEDRHWAFENVDAVLTARVWLSVRADGQTHAP